MTLSATDAKNRFGQVLEQAQREPVFIAKAGRRHSVVMSAEHYDRMVADAGRSAKAAAVARTHHSAEADRYYAEHKDWVDMNNRLVEAHGIPGEEYRTW
jgi:prevent-host-death family protein